MNEKKSPPKLRQCLFAEALGTFILTFIDSAAGILDHHGDGIGGVLGRSLAPAAVVMAAIFFLGEISGAHINPAVTFSFAVRRVFPWKKVPAYLGAQLLGAAVAGALVFALFGSEIERGLTLPQEGMRLAFVFEVLLSSFLMTVILTSSSNASIKGWESAFPVGLVLLFSGLVGKMISGASMNPARSLGPAIFSDQVSTAWLYVLAPLLGALIACAVVYLLKGPPCEKELKAAQGG